jgi:hypothetical protein
MKGAGAISRAIFGVAVALVSSGAHADNFGRVRYDVRSDQLVVTMLYRGSNPDHIFSFKWGECRAKQSDGLPGVTLEVLDDQFQDRALKDYRKTVRFSLTGLPCPRPLSISLTTAPHFFYTLTLPGR